MIIDIIGLHAGGRHRGALSLAFPTAAGDMAPSSARRLAHGAGPVLAPIQRILVLGIGQRRAACPGSTTARYDVSSMWYSQFIAAVADVRGQRRVALADAPGPRPPAVGMVRAMWSTQMRTKLPAGSPPMIERVRGHLLEHHPDIELSAAAGCRAR